MVHCGNYLRSTRTNPNARAGEAQRKRAFDPSALDEHEPEGGRANNSGSLAPNPLALCSTISKEECINFLRHGYASI
jgi:hypothetical protein